jgi:RHS repeat-associated protein
VSKARISTSAARAEGIDAVGLQVRARTRYTYNAFNQLMTVTPGDGSTATTFGYDGNGNQTSKTDASGLTQYVYNQDNRLVGISLPGGDANAFEYDANGLRTKKTDSSGTTRYLLDGLSVIAQYAPSGDRQAWYTQSLARIDEVLNVANDSGKLWYQADALGSVYGLTNQAGALVGSQSYDVFGAPTPAPTGPAGQPFGFTGREHELDSGLVYARARYLNPATGQWDRADPLGQTAGPNYYAYADGRVTIARDPMGLATDTVTAYAAAWPASFIALMIDLGALQQAVVWTAAIGGTAAVAIPIAQMISTKDETKTTTTTCPMPPPTRVWRTYYRGLSIQDLNEFMVLGVVLSKAARAGIDFMTGLLLAASPMTILQHTIKSAGSPFVSVTTSALTANVFAVTGGQASTVVISMETNRTPIPIGGQYSEYLFFWMLGFPGERLRFAWGGN